MYLWAGLVQHLQSGDWTILNIFAKYVVFFGRWHCHLPIRLQWGGLGLETPNVCKTPMFDMF